VEEFLDQYGYIALMVGTFFEGETAILVAASLIYQGFFEIPHTVFFGFAGSFVSDWLYFIIGKVNGKYFVSRRPDLQKKVFPVQRFFEKHHIQVLLTYRFLYGLRVVIPLLIGMSEIPPKKFLLFSIVSGLLWAGIVSSMGYLIGRFLDLETSVFEQNVLYIVVGFAAFGVTLGLLLKRLTFKKIVGEVE
jgi:membrane protein DedA with SNARE-associated domain